MRPPSTVPSNRAALCIFDCDGTLVDSQWTIIACMATAFEGQGLAAPSADAVRRVVGLPLDQAIEILAPEAAATAHAGAVDGYIAAFRQTQRDGGLDDPLYPGTVQVLDGLTDAGWLLGVATGKSHRGLVETLDQHSLEHRFVTLQTADRARGKPHPEMLLKAMDETGAAAADTVMIGDTTYDMMMARNAGTAAIGVAWGYHEAEELLETGAMAVAQTFEDLPRAIAEIMEAHR